MYPLAKYCLYATGLPLLAGFLVTVLVAHDLLGGAVVILAVALAIGLRFIPKLRGYQFTAWIIAVVAAILAVIGYSLNDTVVVFDRIRERFETNRRLDSALVLDQSINQTLSRTIMTKVVTSIVVVALLWWWNPIP